MNFDSFGTPGSPARFSGNMQRMSAAMSNRPGVRYPSPFFDIGHTYLPPTQKSLLKWCRYYYITNPLINTVVHKMSEYPITEIVIDESNAPVKEKWETLLSRDIRYRSFQIEVGLDYYTYGTCVVTLHFPFEKWLICTQCKTKVKAADKDTRYKWRNLDYILSCKKCRHVGPATVQDHNIKDVRRIRLVRWNPEHIHIDQAAIGSDPIYTFELPQTVKNDIMVGRRAVLDTIPDTYIEALKRNKYIRFTSDNVFVFKRPNISQKDNGWGMPLILPVLKDTFYLQILRKAQEAIAADHIVPLRVLFPQAGDGASSPYTTISLDTWKHRIENEIAKWRYDNNYIPVLPLPIGSQTIGGDGKALGLYQEMEVWSRHIVAGMGVPEEFVFGGMQYSGSNVSMRMLENMFLGYRTDHENMLNDFVIKRIASFMGWPPVKAHLRRFKMADDLQRSAFFFQLNQGQKISDQTLLQECDFDPVVEQNRREMELKRLLEFNRRQQIATASIQSEMAIIQAKGQVEAQKLMAAAGLGGDPAAAGGAGAAPAGGAAPSGQEGAMQAGPQVAPGMPEGSTVSAEEAQGAPTEGVPQEMQSPLNQSTQGGGYNLLYLARRAATQLLKVPEMDRYQQLSTMQTSNPQLYALTLQLVNREKGSQSNPLDATQSPLPEVKPTRRAASTGV